MDNLFQKALEAASKDQNYAFATIVESTLKGTPRKIGAKMVVLADGSIFGTIGGGTYEKAAQKECLKALKSGQPKLATYNYFGQENKPLCGGQIKVFIEPFLGKNHLVICGGGHIALPLSAFAKILGFKVTVIDNRKEFANRNRFPHIDKVVCGPHAKKLAQISTSQNTYIVIVTHGHKFDFACLKTALRTKSDYIGVIGSLRKRLKFMQKLTTLGFSMDRLKMVQLPCGIDIGAQTPEEIAISIMAEIINKANNKFVGSEKFKRKI